MKLISLEDVLNMLGYALKMFYDNDHELFCYNTNDPTIAERCMAFHIGHYMLDYRKTNGKFADFDIDYEYNRHLMDKKYIDDAMKKGEKEIFPDLLIHKRKCDSYNLAVIEMKKGKPSIVGADRDVKKLKMLTNKRSMYGYKFGIHLFIYDEKADVAVYKDGYKNMNDYVIDINGNITEI